jgi:hypothetical protein
MAYGVFDRKGVPGGMAQKRRTQGPGLSDMGV